MDERERKADPAGHRADRDPGRGRDVGGGRLHLVQRRQPGRDRAAAVDQERATRRSTAGSTRSAGSPRTTAGGTIPPSIWRSPSIPNGPTSTSASTSTRTTATSSASWSTARTAPSMPSVEMERAEIDAFATLCHGLDRLIRQARAAPMDEPEPATGLLAMGEDVVMVGVSAVTLEENADFELPPGPRVVVIYVKRVDQAFLDALAEPLPLDELRLAPPGAAAPRAALPLRAPDGAELGTLVWKPLQPGWEFLRSVTPSLAIAIAVIAIFTRDRAAPRPPGDRHDRGERAALSRRRRRQLGLDLGDRRRAAPELPVGALRHRHRDLAQARARPAARRPAAFGRERRALGAPSARTSARAGRSATCCACARTIAAARARCASPASRSSTTRASTAAIAAPRPTSRPRSRPSGAPSIWPCTTR